MLLKKNAHQFTQVGIYVQIKDSNAGQSAEMDMYSREIWREANENGHKWVK